MRIVDRAPMHRMHLYYIFQGAIGRLRMVASEEVTSID